MTPRKPLSELEHLVMEVVWSKTSCTSEEVRTALAKRHPMKESTARTMLKRLEEKGYVRHHVDGRTNVYTGSSSRAMSPTMPYAKSSIASAAAPWNNCWSAWSRTTLSMSAN